MADLTPIPINNHNMQKLVDQILAEGTKHTSANYRCFIDDLFNSRRKLIKPEDEELPILLNVCNRLFKNVRTPREGSLDAIALKTLAKYARIQTKTINQKATIEDAFDFTQKCANIINKTIENGGASNDFYTKYCNFHKTTGTMNFMSGRLPTYWLEKKNFKNTPIRSQYSRMKYVIDPSQHTQIQEIKSFSTDGEQTSKEIIRINRCLEQAFENNNYRPVNFFAFTIHPKLFSRSVENIFHVSFLIKEGKAELFLDEYQLPVLRPLYNLNTADSTNSNSNHSLLNNKSKTMSTLTQLVLSLDMEQWENLVQVFEIQKPMIENEN